MHVFQGSKVTVPKLLRKSCSVDRGKNRQWKTRGSNLFIGLPNECQYHDLFVQSSETNIQWMCVAHPSLAFQKIESLVSLVSLFCQFCWSSSGYIW